MNLVHADLKGRRHRTVKFNAWHHQKEEHLFAAMMQAIRDQVVPQWWRPSGIPFRGRLFISRARRQPGWWMAAIVFVILSIGFFLVPTTIPDRVSESVPMVVKAELYFIERVVQIRLRYWIEKLPPSVLALVGVLFAISGFSPTLTQRRVSPGRLMASASGAFRVKAFDDQLGFRHRFGSAFKEVAEALQPKTLMILVDDLDRCRPEKVLETLEAINFLVNAGPCYVVIGFAPEQVIRSIGMKFREIAREMPRKPTENPDSVVDFEATERENRSDYARQYLDKLINIEVPIPRLTDQDATTLSQTTPTDNLQASRKNRRRLVAKWKTRARVALALGLSLAIADIAFEASRSVPKLIDDLVRQLPTPNVTLSSTSVTVREGSSATYSVRLNTRPSSAVTITATQADGSDPDLTVIKGASLTFTATNWNVPQQVTIGAAEDDDWLGGTATFAHIANSLA